MTILNAFLGPVPVLIYIIYFILLIYTLSRILLDTQATSKTLAYMLVVIVLPIIGIFFYYFFGVNYRKRKSNSKIDRSYRSFTGIFAESMIDNTSVLLNENEKFLGQYVSLVRFLKNLDSENLSYNYYSLLTNGEEKFPEVLKILSTATHHIHMEYYDWENDIRGNQIKNILLKKIKEGVKVRIMYDAYASRKIRHNIVKELKNGGAEIYPVIRVKLIGLANRINHRDHRKIIIVDGKTGFVGGINVSDRYDNSIDTGLYWRDTHVMIKGPGVMNLQRHFIINWNACQPEQLEFTEDFFPSVGKSKKETNQELSQIMAGGPIYHMSNIMLTYAKMFSLAQEKLYITNPYFIPNETILDTLKQAAKSGVDVRLMLPKKSDSAIVGATSKFYYAELLYAGVKIFLYKKGFVHAKTAIADGKVSIVGTANMDIRSFDLNFEMMSIIYGNRFAAKMEEAFHNDLKECDELNYNDWESRGKSKKLVYAIARLVSSFM